jgi:hypothetical protein
LIDRDHVHLNLLHYIQFGITLARKSAILEPLAGRRC